MASPIRGSNPPPFAAGPKQKGRVGIKDGLEEDRSERVIAASGKALQGTTETKMKSFTFFHLATLDKKGNQIALPELSLGEKFLRFISKIFSCYVWIDPRSEIMDEKIYLIHKEKFDAQRWKEGEQTRWTDDKFESRFDKAKEGDVSKLTDLSSDIRKKFEHTEERLQNLQRTNPRTRDLKQEWIYLSVRKKVLWEMLYVTYNAMKEKKISFELTKQLLIEKSRELRFTDADLRKLGLIESPKCGEEKKKDAILEGMKQALNPSKNPAPVALSSQAASSVAIVPPKQKTQEEIRLEKEALRKQEEEFAMHCTGELEENYSGLKGVKIEDLTKDQIKEVNEIGKGLRTAAQNLEQVIGHMQNRYFDEIQPCIKGNMTYSSIDGKEEEFNAIKRKVDYFKQRIGKYVTKVDAILAEKARVEKVLRILNDICVECRDETGTGIYFSKLDKEQQTAEKKLLSSMFGKQNISNVSYLREQRAALRERMKNLHDFLFDMEATRSLLVNSTMTTYLSNLEKTISEDLVKLMRMFQQLKMIKNTTATPVASGKSGQQQISIVTDA